MQPDSEKPITDNSSDNPTSTDNNIAPTVSVPSTPNIITPSSVSSSIEQPGEVNHPALSAHPVEPKKPKSKLIYVGALVIFIVIIVALVVGLKHSKKATPVSSVSSSATAQSTSSSALSGVLLTYFSDDGSTIKVTNSNQTVLATLTLPSGAKSFTVLGNNGQEVLIQAATVPDSGYNATDVSDYLVSSKGKVTDLSSAVALPAVEGGSQSIIYVPHSTALGHNNDYLDENCPDASNPSGSIACNVNDINLVTGAVKTLYTSIAIPSGEAVFNNPTIYGVSASNVAYIDHSEASNGSYIEQSDEINTETGKAVNVATDPAESQAFSSDYSQRVYVEGSDENNVYLENLSTGALKSINFAGCSINTLFYWSYNDTKVAFDCEQTVGSSSKYTLGYLNLANDSITLLNSYTAGEPADNLAVRGWSSNSEINYTYITYSSISSDVPIYNYYSVSTSGTVNNSPSPAGYELDTRFKSFTE